jgi:hypothetical protein
MISTDFSSTIERALDLDARKVVTFDSPENPVKQGSWDEFIRG